ncbi:hypothetical protein Pmani_036835 [Petrolisthes manimaculis]|uniref:Uncharacterized protein n=1 Tax=Petrolisthes manimaculis TaxID=1843537 RepID=A0AAE1NHJ8_9EUCA|nr:hypothetical protein Pmani_036835 [Petrolisthes manimaculis]
MVTVVEVIIKLVVEVVVMVGVTVVEVIVKLVVEVVVTVVTVVVVFMVNVSWQVRLVWLGWENHGALLLTRLTDVLTRQKG